MFSLPLSCFPLALVASLSLLLPTAAQGTVSLSLPILSDPSFGLLSGDVLVAQQLGVWGIQLGPISVKLGVDFSAITDLLGRGTSRSLEEGNKRECRRSRILATVATAGAGTASGDREDVEEEEAGVEKRLLGLNLLDLGLNVGSSPSSAATSTSGTPLGTGTANAKGPATMSSEGKALLSLDVSADISLTGWGDADSAARGDQSDTEWYTYIDLGSPPQSIPILPDTGSSDLFVFGPTCSTCDLSNHTSFSPQLSNTYSNLTVPWSFGYADGSGALGYASSDIVSFGGGGGGGGGGSMDTQMDFAIATLVGGSDTVTSKRSGVLGLGLDGMSTIQPSSSSSSASGQNQGKTLFSRLVKSGSLTENVLSVRLVKGQQSQGVVLQPGSGQYTLGGIEEDYVLGGRDGLAWAPVLSSNYWGIAMDDILVGTTSILGGDTSTPRRAIIDTGTTLIITSTPAATAIHALIPGSFQDAGTSIFYIPCTTSYPTTPNVFFSIAGKQLGVPVQDLAWKTSSTYSGMCISGVQGGMSSFTVLGDMFIKNHYVVLSYGSTGNNNTIQVGLGDRTDVAPIL